MRGSQEKTALVFGYHAVLHTLRSGPESALELWIQENLPKKNFGELIALADASGIHIQWVARNTLDRLADSGVHQGVALRRRINRALDESDLPELLGKRSPVPLVLVLDGVQDPHNLGACLRTADAAGVDTVVIPRHRAVGITPTVAKVASGAADSVPVVEAVNLSRVLGKLKELGLWVIGASGDVNQSLFATKLNGPTAIVMGGEENGLRRLTREHCDQLVRIPMHGRVESLNVSVATAVCLYETLRQRDAVASRQD